MHIGILISSSSEEAISNALRFGLFALDKGDDVTIFLLGNGRRATQKAAAPNSIPEQVRAFTGGAGKVYISSTGIHPAILNTLPNVIVADLEMLYDLIEASEKLVTF